MIFGQLDCASATNEVVDPGNFDRIVEQINVCNRNATGVTFRIFVVKHDETLANKHAYVYDLPLLANDRAPFNPNIRLELSDKIYFYGSGTGISVTIVGQRLS